MARDFNKLEIFNMAYSTCLDFYKILTHLPEEEDHNLKDQIRRAATSIPLNIAEGTSRFTKRSVLQFIDYAYGSCKELQVCLKLCHDLNYISAEQFTKLNDKLQYLSVGVYRFLITVYKEEFHDFYKKSPKKKQLKKFLFKKPAQALIKN